jgi:hypothetical protein
MTVADSPANLAVYSKQRGGPRGGGNYPTLRLLALVACGTRTVIDAVFRPVREGETTCAPALIGSLRAGMVLLADRNFGAGLLAAQITAAGADFPIRVRTGTSSEAPRPSPAPRRHLDIGLRRVPGPGRRRADHPRHQRRARPAVDLAGVIGRPSWPAPCPHDLSSGRQHDPNPGQGSVTPSDLPGRHGPAPEPAGKLPGLLMYVRSSPPSMEGMRTTRACEECLILGAEWEAGGAGSATGPFPPPMSRRVDQ